MSELNEEVKVKLAGLGNRFFELKDEALVLKENTDTVKEEIINVMLELNVETLTVGDYEFEYIPKHKMKFNKKDYAIDVGLKKSEVDEKVIAFHVENGKTSSSKIATYMEPSVSQNLKVKKK